MKVKAPSTNAVPGSPPSTLLVTAKVPVTRTTWLRTVMFPCGCAAVSVTLPPMVLAPQAYDGVARHRRRRVVLGHRARRGQQDPVRAARHGGRAGTCPGPGAARGLVGGGAAPRPGEGGLRTVDAVQPVDQLGHVQGAEGAFDDVGHGDCRDRPLGAHGDRLRGRRRPPGVGVVDQAQRGERTLGDGARRADRKVGRRLGDVGLQGEGLAVAPGGALGGLVAGDGDRERGAGPHALGRPGELLGHADRTEDRHGVVGDRDDWRCRQGHRPTTPSVRPA